VNLPRRSGGIILCLWAIIGAGASSRADQGWEGHILELNLENDVTRGSDRHYTAGSHLLYLASDRATPDWLDRFSRWLPFPSSQVQAAKFGFEVGQEIYTPGDLGNPNVVKDDRPFAGWLYESSFLQRRGAMTDQWFAMDQIRLDLGVVGPEALAQEAQDLFHQRDPRGWPNQLDSEFGVNLRYDLHYLYRCSSRNNWSFDFIPAASGSLGNVQSFLGLGTTFRCGYNIPNEFEIPGKKTELKWGFYFFAGAGGRVVLQNIFLDGNTWHDSHSVDKEPFVGDIRAGATLALKAFELSFFQNVRTEEFKKQKDVDSYGSVTIRFKF
jgi:lipid A 3-O-deacylase